MTVPLLLLLLLLLLVPTARTVAPDPPLHCNDAGTDCVLTNAFGAWGARAAVKATSCGDARWDVRFPTTETELVAAVADAARGRMPVKAVSGFSHTIPAWACPDGAGGDGPAMIISTRDLTATLEIDAAAGTVTAGAGVGFRRLIDELAAQGWALDGAPYWDGASVAGILATASHGSGSGAALHDHLLAVTLVYPVEAAPFARSVLLCRGDPDFDAAAVSLGLMGVVSSVTLAMQPMFKRNVTYHLLRDDAGLENFLATFSATHDFPDITWFPSRRKALLRADDRAPASAEGDGVNDYLGFRALPSAVAEATRASENLAESTRNSAARCVLADTVVALKVALGNGLRRRPGDAVFTGYPVVGFQHRMQTSGGCSRSPKSDLLSRCAWDPRIHGLFFYESTAVFSPAASAAFIRDVKLLREAVGAERLCGLDVYNGFLIRFVRGAASSAYLGYAEDAVVMDFNYYRSHNVDVAGGTPRMDEDVLEEIEQMAFFKHRARPHWAKNRNVAFVGTRAKLPRLPRFLQVRDKYDPQGLFWSDWARRVLLRDEAQVLGDGCALDGMCVCSKDEHCAPARRYFCRPGVVYPDARVCRYEAVGRPSGEPAPAPTFTE